MNLEKISKKASLKLIRDTKNLRIESKFYFSDRGNLGLLFFLLIALLGMYISFFEVKEKGVQIFLSVLSIAILVFTIMVILKQLKDFVEVSKGSLKFSNSLKEKDIYLNSEFKIKVKSEIIYVKTRNLGSGSYFCIVELFLKIKDENIEF